ncbi:MULTISPECIES: TonB-dependent receptor plug domain-containing protein [Empedobacter]|uniref:TonB-dependent receptor plug domain-containing protein n=1 Tax=Empedobacter TaxID=59734 RepID=UPI001C8E1FE8|nr:MULTISPECIES: TonB-dependent receptor [Empedobacter]MBY0067188.1 TonB-dependent receptor [Empedobacter falsenii]
MKKLFLCFNLIAGIAFAQTDTINLKPLILNDAFLKNHYKSQSIIKLNDSILEQNPNQLTQVLQAQTPIYFKENGRGMVSSPSFRGTLASHTAVIWNGINVNSQTTGQTDFNLFASNSFDGILVKPGGGSIAYGTGSIGGTIHLLNKFEYDKGLQQKINLGYGSYDTWSGKYQLKYSTEKFSSSIDYERNQSDNDYKIPNHMKKNLNGKYYFNTINGNFGYKINPENELKLYSMINFGKREFPLVDIGSTPSGYENKDYRLMTEWNFNPNEKWLSQLKLAYIREENSYFNNIHKSYSDDLQVDNYVLKYYLNHQLTNNFELSFLSEANYNQGSGNNLNKSDQNSINFALIAKHKLSDVLEYEASIRQDFSDTYQNPFIYSLGFNFRPIHSYQLRGNVSKNFRNPTYNDLFWKTGGNPDLKSESAYQFELGNDFINKNLNIQTNIFYNKLSDMIQWIPSSQNTSYWVPVNINKAETYGFEMIGSYKWNAFSFNTTYAYTKTKDKFKNKELMYSPNHKWTASAQYTYKRLSAFVQNIYTSKVFTDSEEERTLDGFWLTNLGLNFTISPLYSVSMSVNNVFNQEYQTQENRWQPGTNYNIQIQIKF